MPACAVRSWPGLATRSRTSGMPPKLLLFETSSRSFPAAGARVQSTAPVGVISPAATPYAKPPPAAAAAPGSASASRPMRARRRMGGELTPSRDDRHRNGHLRAHSAFVEPPDAQPARLLDGDPKAQPDPEEGPRLCFADEQCLGRQLPVGADERGEGPPRRATLDEERAAHLLPGAERLEEDGRQVGQPSWRQHGPRLERARNARACSRFPGALLASRREGEQCDSTGPRPERRQRGEAAPEAGPAGREAPPARDARAGGGDRTRITSLEGWGSTIELRPRGARE